VSVYREVLHEHTRTHTCTIVYTVQPIPLGVTKISPLDIFERGVIPFDRTVTQKCVCVRVCD